MKPTYISHDASRFRFPDYSAARSWSVVENTRPQLMEPDQKMRQMRSKVTCRSLGLSRSNAVEPDYREGFDDPYKSGLVDPWTLLSRKEDKGPSPPPRNLLRSRSHIRTNPWMPSTTNESPPRSPAARKVHLCRCWSAVERGPSPSSGSNSPPITRLRSTNVEKEDVFSRFLYRRDDSLLTTSVESDSLYQSLTSDTDTATSLLSVSDVTLPPEVFRDERSRDDVGFEGKEGDRSVLTPLVRYDGGQDRRGFLSDRNFTSEDFEPDRNPTKEIRKCGRAGSSGHDFNLQPLKRPSFEGGKRFSEIADDFEAKTSKWLNSGEGGLTTQRSQSTQSTNISVARGDNFAEQPNPRPSTNIQQEIPIKRDELDEPTSSYESPFSTSLQFRKKMMAVRSSLQEKVAMLRREKRMVDEKIREAKEEERIRLLQLDKFRRQLSSTRKEILLRTIEELKRSLNEQSLKLQKVYDIVLLEQRQTMCCH